MPEKTVDLTDQARALVRLSQAVQGPMQQGPSFSPGAPIEPLRDDEAPALFEYQPGVNLTITPRVGFGALLSFPMLRALSQVKEIRLNIELIKRQMCGLKWSIVPAQEDTRPETASVTRFFQRPNGVDEWDAWLKQVLEDLLVIDAVTLYPEFGAGQTLAELSIVDGATIRPLIDFRGRIPRPPMPAYIQVLRGRNETWYSRESLLYKPLNAKAHTVYGESPIEWVLQEINTAIRKSASRLAYFTDGNIPGALVYLGDLTTEQVKVIEGYVNALMSGDIARASRLLFLPGGGSGTSVFPFQQNDQDNTALDSWLMQVACWAFGNSPAEFGLIPGSGGLGGAGYMAGAEGTQFRTMIGPICAYLENIVNRVIRDFMGRPDVVFQWEEAAPPEDALKNAQVDQIYIAAGVYQAGYVQDRLGVPEQWRAGPPPAQPAAQPDDLLAGLTVNPAALAPYVSGAIKADLSDWRERARRDFKRDGRVVLFKSRVIPPEIYAQLTTQLQAARSLADIDAAFDRARLAPLDPARILSKAANAAPAREVGGEKPFRYP